MQQFLARAPVPAADAPGDGCRPAPASALDTVLPALARGGAAVLLDTVAEPTRGYVVQAAEHATAESVNLMARFARGIVSVALLGTRCNELGIVRSRQRGDARVEQGFTIEARTGVTTGISAADRARTARVLGDPAARAGDLVTPGHIVPIAIDPMGPGPGTSGPEAALRLVQLAGCSDAAVICLVLDEDGAAADHRAAAAMAREHDLPIATTADVVAFSSRGPSVERVGERSIAVGGTDLRQVVYAQRGLPARHQALVLGDVAQPAPVLVLVHAQDPLADPFDEAPAGARARLTASLASIAAAGRGVLLHLANRTDAQAVHPWLPQVAAEILADLGVRTISSTSSQSPETLAEPRSRDVHDDTAHPHA